MKFNDRIRALRTQLSITQRELGNMLGVSVVTIRNWESGNKNPSMQAIIDLSNVFGVTIDYLLGVVPNREADYLLLDKREKRLLSNYRELDYYGKDAVDSVCDVEWRRVNDKIIKVAFDTTKASRYIPRYITPSAAGFSVPLDGNDFEMILVDENTPPDADFAVVIQGDSMLPYIHDGDTVFVKKDAELCVGDIGIFGVDGSMYCKQYYVDGVGNLTLVSSNEKRKSANVVIPRDSGRDIRCFGKVLLEEKTPLPDYFIGDSVKGEE